LSFALVCNSEILCLHYWLSEIEKGDASTNWLGIQKIKEQMLVRLKDLNTYALRCPNRFEEFGTQIWGRGWGGIKVGMNTIVYQCAM